MELELFAERRPKSVTSFRAMAIWLSLITRVISVIFAFDLRVSSTAIWSTTWPPDATLGLVTNEARPLGRAAHQMQGDAVLADVQFLLVQHGPAFPG